MNGITMQSTAEKDSSGIVFFSGGTALNETASALARLASSTHIVTTFDSGGSTAALRKVLPIPAVGDIRARLLALADTSREGVKALCKALQHRLPVDAPNSALREEFCALAEGDHPLMHALAAPERTLFTQALRSFISLIPSSFCYSGASIGNIILAAEYVASGGYLAQAIHGLATRLHCRGRVLAVSETPAHLAVRLEDGHTMVGQHRFTGKWEREIQSPITDVWLTRDKGSPARHPVDPGPGVLSALGDASCLCFPIGSFFSSVAANLLVRGVGRAISWASCPKVFIPNPGTDPELFGLSLLGQVKVLLRLMNRDAPEASPRDFITAVLVDREKGQYAGGIPDDELAALGIAVMDADLAEEGDGEDAGQPRIHGAKLAAELCRVVSL